MVSSTWKRLHKRIQGTSWGVGEREEGQQCSPGKLVPSSLWQRKGKGLKHENGPALPLAAIWPLLCPIALAQRDGPPGSRAVGLRLQKRKEGDSKSFKGPSLGKQVTATTSRGLALNFSSTVSTSCDPEN